MAARLTSMGNAGSAGATAVATPRPTLRRLLVTIGVVASLVAAGATIRAASLWAATQAPLNIAPVSVDSVRQALAQEKSRSAVLEDQISGLQSNAADLESALQSARDQLVTDQTTADQLRASLAAAQAKLATLEAALAKQAKSTSGTTSGSTSGSSGTSGGSDDGGGYDD
jgi:septal ring factor EnvC (AmiA/AmiB activator)